MEPELCQECGHGMAEGGCPRCLLATELAGEGQSEAERIFQAALSYDPAERVAFVQAAAAGNAEVLAEVEMLLHGHALVGGDDGVRPTSGEKAGLVVGPFRLVKIIGEGGMGAVWEAEQREPVRRTVALKLVKLGMDTREVIARFARERQALALMKHPNIAQVYEAGATGSGRPYFAMELVEGVPVNEFCDTRGLTVRERLTLFLSLCEAIEHAHQKGVIHRDLKPSNVLVTHDGIAKVIDFGVAKATQDTGEVNFTRHAQVLGTPAYMSPEQAASAGADVDTRTDVYSLGVVLYELLSGTLPFDPQRLAKTSIGEMQKILRDEEPPRPSTRLRAQTRTAVPAVPRAVFADDLDWIVMMALSKERERRYAGAAAFAADVRRYLAGEVVIAVPPTAGYRLGKFLRRHRVAVSSAAAIFLMLITALAVSLFQMRRASRAQDALILTVADLYTNNGVNADGYGDAAVASLWFARAAVTARGDPERVELGRVRSAAWRQEIRTAVRAFDTGEDYATYPQWNPSHPALLVWIENSYNAQVWDLTGLARRWEIAGGPVRAAAWSPTGDRLVVGGISGLRVLSYPSGDELAGLADPAVTSVAWHPGGEWVAMTRGGGPARLWNVETGQTATLDSTAIPTRTKFSADGRWLLVQAEEQTAIHSATLPFSRLGPAIPSDRNVLSAFLARGDAFVTQEDGGDLVVRGTADGAEQERRAMPVPAGRGPWTSPDGRFLLAAGQQLVDRVKGVVLATPVHDGQWMRAAFSPDGRWLATGGYDNKLRLWSLPDGAAAGEIGDPHHAVVGLSFSPDSSLLAATEQGRVRVWRMDRPVTERRVDVPDGAESGVALSPDGKWLAFSGTGRETCTLRRTRVCEVASGAAAGPDLDPGGLIMGAVFDRESRWLALAVSTTAERSMAAMLENPGGGTIQFWDFREGRRLGDPIPMPSEPRGICVHPSGEWLGVSCAGGQSLEIGIADRAVRPLFQHPHPDSRNGAAANSGRCAYSPDGGVFAVWGPYETHVLWHRREARHLIDPWRPDITVFDLQFAGNVVANTVVTRDGSLEFRDLRSGEMLRPPLPYTNWAMTGRFSPDARLFLAGGGDDRAQVHDWREGTPAGPSVPHRQGVVTGLFLPGGSRVATAGYSGEVRFWDYRTGRPLRPDLRLPGPVLDLQLADAGQTLVVTGNFGYAGLYDFARLFPGPALDPAAALELAEIDANAEVAPGGGLLRLSPAAWMAKWQAFRAAHPDFRGHRLE